MTLATILIVLLIDRLLWQGDALREHRWFDSYTDRLLNLATGQWLTRKEHGALWLLLPVLLLIALLQGLGGNTAGLVIGVGVLLFTLGPRDLGRDVDAYLTARTRGDDDRSREQAATLAGDAVPETEPERAMAVARGVLQQSLPRLFAPLLWFVLIGPLGAVLYRLTDLTARRSSHHDKAPSQLGISAQRLLALLDWLPARLAVAAFAAAGSFNAVSRVWREHQGADGDQRDVDTLLTNAGRSALDSWPDQEEIDAGEEVPVVEDALALVWRSLVVWLIALLVLTLFAVAL
jgi:membrane protein required for beta-lactamase induction